MHQQITTIGRRDALALLAGLAAFGPAAAQSPSAQPLAERAAFLQASALATGMDEADLTGLVDPLLAHFRDQAPLLRDLAALAKATPPPDLPAAIAGTPMEPLARALAAAWYTGALGATLLSYEDALSWKAAGFQSVPGQCAGEFGVWSEPPATP